MATKKSHPNGSHKKVLKDCFGEGYQAMISSFTYMPMCTPLQLPVGRFVFNGVVPVETHLTKTSFLAFFE